MAKTKNQHCSFCKKSNVEVVKLIAGPDVFICNECVDMCNEIIAEESESSKEADLPLQPVVVQRPRVIYEKLSEYVIGQEYAKKVISVGVYKHYQRVTIPLIGVGRSIKENILLIGPTGTGKTLLANTLAKVLNVPVSLSDATALTEAGYVGEDVETVLAFLLRAAGDDVRRAENGIVYIDEIDKIGRKQSNPSITRDVSGEGVQHALLSMLGGGVVRVDPKNKRKHPGGELVEINTDNILFICGGSFEGIEQIVLNRLKRQIGSDVRDISTTPDELRQRITHADLVTFGFAPEFAARFTTIVPLSSLDEADLVRILTDSRDSLLKDYERYFSAEGTELSFTEDAVRVIARQSLQNRAGVRGLRGVLDRVLMDILFEVPGRRDISQCIIDYQVIESGIPPTLLNGEGKQVVLKRNQVFVSYSQQDAHWLDEFKKILSPMMRNRTIDVWYDKKIKPSQQWRKEVEAALAAAKVAVLLVSPNFLASEFVMTEEFPYLLRVAETEGVLLVWVLLSPCLYEETPLRHYQAAHNIARPLDSLSPSERGEVWVMICKHIKEAANAPTGPP